MRAGHAELLELATPQGREMWQDVSLAYTETQGLPELRRLISERLYDEARLADELRLGSWPSARLTGLCDVSRYESRGLEQVCVSMSMGQGRCKRRDRHAIGLRVGSGL